MKAPTEKVTDAELVEMIMRQLKAPKMKGEVEDCIPKLRAIHESGFFVPATEKINKKIAKQGLKWINDAERWLKEANDANFLDSLFPLFTPDQVRRVKEKLKEELDRLKLPEAAKAKLDRLKWPDDIPSSFIDGTSLYESTLFFFSELRDHCELILKHRYGAHGNTDHASWRAAIFAYEFCKHAKQPVRWWDEDGPYCVVTGLFYQGITGKEATGMQRSCRTVAEFLDGKTRSPFVR